MQDGTGSGALQEAGGKDMSANRSPAGKAQRSPRVPAARHVRLSAMLVLALAAALLTLALGIATANAAPAAAYSLPAAIPSGTPSPTATATATPPASGTLTLVSPSYGKGPAGAHVTVSGSGFSGSSVSLFASTHANCSNTKAPLGSYPLSGGAFANQTVVWPALAPGTYYICAPGLSGGAPSYQQLSASPPSISLSAPRVPAGSSLTISGTNFAGLPAGAPIVVLAQQNGTAINLPAAVLDDNGSFTLPWTVDENLNGLVTIKALSSPEGSAPSVLQASAVVTVLPPATATPTTTTTPTATVAAGTGQTSTTRGNSNGGGGGVLLLLGLLALIVLAGVGVGAFLLLRGRAGPGVQKGYPGGPGGYGGFGPTGGYPGTDPSGTTGRMSSAGYPAQFGGSGDYGPGEYGGASIGAVSQWDDVPGEPAPGWQPRPMTGYGHFDLPPDDASSTQEWQPGGAPPDDPWAEPPYGGARGGYGGDPGYAGGQRYGSGGQSGWGSGGAEDGTGTTRPGYGGQGYGQDDSYGQPGSRGTGRYPPADRHPDDYDDAGDRGPWPDPRTGGGGSGRGW